MIVIVCSVSLVSAFTPTTEDEFNYTCIPKASSNSMETYRFFVVESECQRNAAYEIEAVRKVSL